MTKPNSNSRSTQTVTADAIQRDIDAAISCHNTSKGQAAEAVAHALLAWRAAQGPNATPKAKAWADAAIAKRNLAIDQRNEEFRKAKSKERLVRVDMKETAARFTKWIKFVFNFQQVSQASLVSRYSTVIEWADWKFKDRQIHSVSEITDAINAAGGFEEVLSLKRGKQPKPAANDNQMLAKKVLTQIKASATSSPSVSTYSTAIDGADKLVVSLGRSNNGKVEVVSTVPLPTEGADHVLWLFEEDLGPKVPETTAFVAQVLELADLVTEGRATRHKEDGISAGKPLKEERVLTLAAVGNTVILGASARHADASVVLEAQPTSAQIKLDAPTQCMVMQRHDHQVLAEVLRGRSIRALVTLSTNVDATGGSLTWTTTPEVGDANTYTWQPIANHTHKPLTTDGFVASFSIDVKAADIAKLLNERLVVWEKMERSAPKSTKTTRVSKRHSRKEITLTFTQDALRYSMEADADLVLPTTGTVTSPVALKFRPRDALTLMRKLKDQKATAFKLSGDVGGMLRVSWSDHLGTYNIYQPTVNRNGDLETKRLVAMTPPAVAPLAA